MIWVKTYFPTYLKTSFDLLARFFALLRMTARSKPNSPSVILATADSARMSSLSGAKDLFGRTSEIIKKSAYGIAISAFLFLSYFKVIVTIKPSTLLPLTS